MRQLSLDPEYISSLLYRHRDENATSEYLSFFGFNSQEEPFPLFIMQYFTVHEAIDRFKLHISDHVQQKKSILLMVSSIRRGMRTAFDYINGQLKFLLPQNIHAHMVDLGYGRPSPNWLLKEIMKQCGVREVHKKERRNIEKLKRRLIDDWIEYRRKRYFALFRSDNLTSRQLALLKELSIEYKNEPLCFFLLEGSIDTYHRIYDLRKQSIDDVFWRTLFITHPPSMDTAKINYSKKLKDSMENFFSNQIITILHFIKTVDNEYIPEYPLIHSFLFRMFKRNIKKLENAREFSEILTEIQKENDEFVKKAPEYKKRLEHHDYIFPPELLRDGPSITEARRFFEWMKWEA